MQGDSRGRQGNEGSLDLRHYLQVVWKRKWLILAILGVTVGSAWVFQDQQERIFMATATVLIEPEPPRVVNIQDVAPGTGSASEYYATQYRVITSRPIAEATIERLLAVAWWDWPVDRITRNLGAIRGGDVDALERVE